MRHPLLVGAAYTGTDSSNKKESANGSARLPFLQTRCTQQECQALIYAHYQQLCESKLTFAFQFDRNMARQFHFRNGVVDAMSAKFQTQDWPSHASNVGGGRKLSTRQYVFVDRAI